jgi:glycerol-3-phosphate dehydrogenase (NAD(P)+)
MQFGIIGSGSWATALAKILTDNNRKINWWIRNENTVMHIRERRHNPHYLHTAYFNNELLQMTGSIEFVIENSDVLVIAVPSAYIKNALDNLHEDIFQNKKIVSAIKGILPEENELLNEYLKRQFNVSLENYFTVLGPCHAEEVAAEKLSYLTFSGIDEDYAKKIAAHFNTDYLNTLVNHDVTGVQYAAILKNIYALGAGIAHGLEYGDNFLSVYIANSANEMVHFLRRAVKYDDEKERDEINYAASVYLGDLLVTCYSLYSRNRMFGNMIGKGYSVKAAQLELSMVAEGYNASKCIFKTNETVRAEMPIATTIYEILWQHFPAHQGFEKIEKLLI